MNDFLIQIEAGADADALADLLRNRPCVSEHPVHTFEFPWGCVAVQPPVSVGYAPLHDEDGLTFCVGRPRFMGVEHEQRGAAGFAAMFREKLAGDAQALGDALTGMFAAVECDRSRVRVLTDPMAFMPVYVGRDADGRVAAIGTHLESVAALAGRETDFDLVSLGDLLVSQYITFPYTTRRGVSQLEPASLNAFSLSGPGEVRGGDVKTTLLWQPREPGPGEWPAVEALEAELEAALRFAAEDVARGASRIAVTLSGGLDSRLVLASLPKEKVAGAVTYATRENREVEVARRVAQAAGIRHHIAWRGEEFYAELMPRAVGLLGTELRGDCHGFCVPDNQLDRTYDLVVGGFLSDTLFKGHYLSEAAKENLRLRERSLYDRAKRKAAGAARAIGVLPAVKQKTHFWQAAKNMAPRLRPEIRDGVAERHRIRLEQVRRVRPESAEEWLRFWPGSRGDGAYGPQANARLFPVDELFMHRRLIEVAARGPLSQKLNGRLAKRVFPRLYGELGKIENASTGLRADADPATRRPRRDAQPAAPDAPSPYPWNDVQNSWVDYEKLQKLSPRWSAYRAALADSPALGVMDGVLTGGVREFIGAYREEAGFLFNRAAMQLTYALDRTLRGR